MYTIKAVSEATGLSIETLRAWERRYAVVVPRRDANGIRRYAPEHIVRLKMLREATERGHAISGLAQRSDSELTQPSSASAQSLVTEILEAAENYRPEQCGQALMLALTSLSVSEVVNKVISPALRKANDRVKAGKFAVAQQRILCIAVRQAVAVAIGTYSRILVGKPLLLATASNDACEVRVYLAGLLASAAGIRCQYLGHGVPSEELVLVCERMGARGFVQEASGTGSRDVRKLNGLARQLPHGVYLLVDDQATKDLRRESLDRRLTLVPGMKSLERHLAKWGTERSPRPAV
jgi:MerR family transcriptional regulator, light-induced transcriptional regulator